MKVDFIFDEGSSKEDAYLIKDNIFGVFDGFNSLDKFIDKNNTTGGKIAAIITKDEFSKNNKDLKDLALAANRKIKQKMIASSINLTKKRKVFASTAAVVRIKEKSFEWLQVADSLVLVIYNNGSFKLLAQDYDHDKEILKIWKKLADQKKKNILELIGDLSIKLRNKMNLDYGCLNGNKKVINFLKSGEEKLNNIKHILLFTDGLFIPKEDPSKEDDWKLFVKLYLEDGLKNVKNYVRRLEKNDPHCWKYPRYKQYDDIAAISVSF